MVEFNQDNRFLQISKLEGKQFLLTGFDGEEALSQPYHFRLELISDELALDISKMVSKSVSFSAKLPDDKLRYFHGKVLRIAAGEVDSVEDAEQIRHYRADVVPDFWFLKFSADCRIFQEKTTPQIVEQVLKDGGLTNYKLSLKGSYTKHDYCVQYNETDYHFVTRLLEEAGIFYFFNHEDTKNQLILADAASSYAACSESNVELSERFGMQNPGEITKWEHQIEFTTGNYVQWDYNFETPDDNLETKEKTIVKFPNSVSNYSVYEYPGNYLKTADGKPITVARMEQAELAHKTVTGESTCVSFSPGGKFKLAKHPVAGEKNLQYTLKSVAHSAIEPTISFSGDEFSTLPYRNRFTCFPAKVAFRPDRSTPKPRVHGLHSAKVVGAKNQEILADKYGRVKVQFQWDRTGKLDDKSSCWVRVAQGWAGNKWGMLFTPRVGDEVIVDFLDGDIDRPIVVGSLYNANNMPPYNPADKGYVSGIKTYSTTKAKAKNFNELRFEDRIGNELIYIHAERDFERVVENNDKLKIGFDTQDPGEQTIDIYNNRIVTIDKGNDALTLKTGSRTMNLDKGNHEITIKQGDQKIKISAGKSSLEAAKEILLKVGSNSIKIDTQGITISGMKVDIKGDLKASLKATMVDVAGSAMTNIKGGLVKIN